MWEVHSGVAGKLSLIGVKHLLFREEPGKVNRI